MGINNIVFLGDNRIRGNYGCRGTSTALSLLLGSKFKIVGRVTGNVTETFPRIFYIAGMPKFAYSLLGRIRIWIKIQPIAARAVYWLGRKLGKQQWFDFVSLDMEKSIKNFRRCLPANPLLKELDMSQYDFDALVVNGEGSFIFTTPQWREPLVMLMVIHWAQKLGKKAYFLNAMFSDRPNNKRNESTLKLANDILSKCEVVVTREEMSFKYVKSHLPAIDPILIPDALFTWYDLVNDNHKITNGKYYLAHDSECDEYYTTFDFTKPYILVSGSSSPNVIEKKEKAISAYSSLVNALKEAFNGDVYLIQVCEGDAFLNEVAHQTNTPILSLTTPLLAAAKILANARVYVSGRYHPAIMASLGGTPCVFMGSNSHKTWSLQGLLEYDKIEEFNSIPTIQDIDKIVKRSISLSENVEIRYKIKARSHQLSIQSKAMLELVK